MLERLEALARGMADVHPEGITSHLYAGQTMACILAERLAIRHLLADPELQPLILPNEDYGNAAQQTHPRAAPGHPGESDSHGQVYLSQAVQEWIDAHCRGRSAWDVERQALCRVVLEQFIAACGDKPVSAYRKNDGRRLIALLRRLPPNLSKLASRNGDLYATAAAAAKRGLSPQNDRTVNKKIGIVNQCFRWIIAHFDECSTSPVAGMKLRIRQSVKEEHEPFYR